MDWQLKPAAKASEFSGLIFEPGKTIVSILTRDESGELIRLDFLDSEWETMTPPTPLLGRWTHLIRDKSDPAAHKKEQIRNAEVLFLSLFEDVEKKSGENENSERIESNDPLDKDLSEDTMSESDLDMLKYLLSILLERKRIIKLHGTPGMPKSQNYRHVKSGQIMNVPVIDLTSENALILYHQLQKLMPGL